jgi:hypothetical protein
MYTIQCGGIAFDRITNKGLYQGEYEDVERGRVLTHCSLRVLGGKYPELVGIIYPS